jgi:hypothetical protein
MTQQTASVMDPFPTTAELYVDLACRKLPVVSDVLHRFGDLSLIDYLDHLTPESGRPFQEGGALFKIIHQEIADLLGIEIARKTVEDLEKLPVVLTANHQGVDYFAQSIQGTLIFALNRIAKKTGLQTVPVFSCGNVPLDNLTYPRGVLLYRVEESALNEMPKRLPLFPDSMKRTMVSMSPPFTDAMVQAVKARLSNLVRKNVVQQSLEPFLQEILEKDYRLACRPELSSYSSQASIVNHRIWKRLFDNVPNVPELIYLELEKVAAKTLAADLGNPKSLGFLVLFDPALKDRVINELDDAMSCWNLTKLKQRLNSRGVSAARMPFLNNCGTVFFWGIDSSGRKIPLYLVRESAGKEYLKGIDDRGGLFELSYTPESILDGLEHNRLLPALFTCFLVLSFARGIRCPGGYFKEMYVPEMHRGLVNALRETRNEDIAHRIGTYRRSYLSGMMAVMSEINGEYLVPAGPVEIISSGGLTGKDIEKMQALSVREAHLAGLFETVQDLLPPEERPLDWKRELARDCFKLMKKKAVLLK